MFAIGLFCCYQGGIVLWMTLTGQEEDDDEFDAESSHRGDVVQEDLLGDKLVTKYQGSGVLRHHGRRARYTPMFLVLLAIEVTDVAFCIDGVSTIFMVDHDHVWTLFVGDIIAACVVRALYPQLAGTVELFPDLNYSVAAVLKLVGLDMCCGVFGLDFPPGWLALSMGVLFALGMISSVLRGVCRVAEQDDGETETREKSAEDRVVRRDVRAPDFRSTTMGLSTPNAARATAILVTLAFVHSRWCARVARTSPPHPLQGIPAPRRRFPVSSRNTLAKSMALRAPAPPSVKMSNDGAVPLRARRSRMRSAGPARRTPGSAGLGSTSATAETSTDGNARRSAEPPRPPRRRRAAGAGWLSTIFGTSTSGSANRSETRLAATCLRKRAGRPVLSSTSPRRRSRGRGTGGDRARRLERRSGSRYNDEKSWCASRRAVSSARALSTRTRAVPRGGRPSSQNASSPSSACSRRRASNACHLVTHQPVERVAPELRTRVDFRPPRRAPGTRADGRGRAPAAGRRCGASARGARGNPQGERPASRRSRRVLHWHAGPWSVANATRYLAFDSSFVMDDCDEMDFCGSPARSPTSSRAPVLFARVRTPVPLIVAPPRDSTRHAPRPHASEYPRHTALNSSR